MRGRLESPRAHALLANRFRMVPVHGSDSESVHPSTALMSTLTLQSELLISTNALAVLLIPKSLTSYQIYPELLPTLLFIPLAVGGGYFLGHFDKSGGVVLMDAQCPPNPGPYNMRYVGVGHIDHILCNFVTIFQTSFDPTTLPFSVDFLASLAALVAFTFIEAGRRNRSIALAFPAALGILYHTLSGAIIFPLFWLALILSGHHRLERVSARIDRANAEAAFFAVLAGFVLPSALMFSLQDPIVTALWQPFAMWMWVAKTGHLLFRPPSRYHESGYWTVQATFIFTFIISAISHIAILWMTWGDLVLLKHLYVPPISPPDPATTSLTLAAHVVLQWDAAFTFCSSVVGTLWFARNAKQVALIALWSVIASVIVGPGAAVSGVLIWREWRLNGAPEAAKEKIN